MGFPDTLQEEVNWSWILLSGFTVYSQVPNDLGGWGGGFFSYIINMGLE